MIRFVPPEMATLALFPLIAFTFTPAHAGVRVSAFQPENRKGTNYWNGGSAIDGKPETAWSVPGESANKGEWIELDIPKGNVEKIGVVAGWDKDEDSFKDYPRVKELRVEVYSIDHSQKAWLVGYESVNVADRRGLQIIPLAKTVVVGNDSVFGGTVRFIIEDVYEGDDYPNLRVSELAVYMEEMDESPAATLEAGDPAPTSNSTFATATSAILSRYWAYQDDTPLCAVLTEIEIMTAYGVAPENPEVTAAWYVLSGAYVEGSGVPFARLGEALTVAGLPAKRRQLTKLSDLQRYTSRGYAIMAALNPEALWYFNNDDSSARFIADLSSRRSPTGDHVVWVTDIANGNVYVNDTALPGGAGIAWDAERFDRVWASAGRWAVVVEKVLPPLDLDGDGKPPVDADADGYASATTGGNDCDDRRFDVHPDTAEVPYDGVDQDCLAGDLDDLDGDGHAAITAGGDDCEDRDARVIQLAFYVDADGDGFTAARGAPRRACTPPPGYSAARGTDCDDGDATVHPLARDVPYDGVDQDCAGGDNDDADGDGFVRAEDCDDADPQVSQLHRYEDGDGDGYGAGAVKAACSEGAAERRGLVKKKGDCNDNDASVHPGAADAPLDGADSNCDGDDEEDASLDGHEFTAIDASQFDGIDVTHWRCACGREYETRELAEAHKARKQKRAALVILGFTASRHGEAGEALCTCGLRFGNDHGLLRHLVAEARKVEMRRGE
ncbi:hypothetical protein LBMAG42_51650 [Deltaproteobacteria bacterium]|nr:hypothetical protein LBMAG42_51650 [Deltaproteobacteria bacterium]